MVRTQVHHACRVTFQWLLFAYGLWGLEVDWGSRASNNRYRLFKIENKNSTKDAEHVLHSPIHIPLDCL